MRHGGFSNHTAWVVSVALLLTGVPVRGQPFSWQSPHATVIPTGDLQWAPQPFTYTPGGTVNYIDYEGGNDNNSGTSPTSAWKHHPWDANATGNARNASGVRTYVFKRGVIYRGLLVARESGTPGNPIRLTSDPSWGTGEAMLFGSERVTTQWTQCTAGDAVTNLNPANVWFTDLNFTITDNPYGSYPTWPRGVWTQTVCEMADTLVRRINLCREPDWTVTNVNDPMLNWWTVRGPSAGNIYLGASFPQQTASDWVGGSVWCNWGSGSGAGANMATVQQGTISGFTAPNIIQFDITTNPNCKYFVENLPQLLDEPNEYYYVASGNRARRLYIRLSGDRNPNNVAIEVGCRPNIIRITDRSHIVISGLTFGITNQPRPGTAPEPVHWNTKDGGCAAIEFGGNISNVQISNCKFRYVSMAIAPRRDPDVNPTTFTNVSITDNDIAYNDCQAITLGSNTPCRDCYVLRNKLYHIGHRQTCRNYSSIPAIQVDAATSAEIAGNIIDYCAGTGINTYSTSASSGTGPQIKVLVHHNKVTTSLLMLNDYGGIEGWGHGPVYFFNNVSGNPRGFRCFSGENEYNPWGMAYYFDHANRHIAVNNIAWGIHNSTTSAAERNGTGFMQAVSQTNYYFNNTIYKFYRGFTFQSPQCFYIGNILEDISLQFHDDNNTANQLAYARNVYYGSPQRFSESAATFSAFQSRLSSGGAISSQLGLQASSSVLTNPANRDFTPRGQALVNGARVFLHWNLPNNVGVWNFYAHPADYTTIRSDDSPSGGTGNVLRCPGANANSYVAGALETWTNGALRFNGSSTYCNANDNAAMDMTTNNFIIEVYLRTSSAGTVVSKISSSGYALEITSGGQARLRLVSGGEYSRSSSATVNDGNWHHIVAEVIRSTSTVNMYVDGALSNGATSGTMPAAGTSLSTSAAFEVGRTSGAGNYFNGDIDFLRVAKSSFADGGTSYAELYAWELDGPGVRDFAWQKVTGPRDAGAIQYTGVGTRLGGRHTIAAPQVAVRYLAGARTFVVRVAGMASGDEQVRFVVINPAGRTVWERTVSAGRLSAGGSMEIGTGTWGKGVYLLRVSTDNHTQVVRLPLFR